MILSTSRMDLYLGMWPTARASNILNNCTALRNGTGKPAAPSKDHGCQWWAPVILFGGTIDLSLMTGLIAVIALHIHLNSSEWVEFNAPLDTI